MREIVKAFDVFGVSSYEAKAYAALLGEGDSPATEVSRQSDVPLSKIYEVLNKLHDKGFVMKDPDSYPKEYRAVRPEIAVEGMVEERKEEFEEAREVLMERLEADEDGDDKSIWRVRGRRTVDRLIDSLLQGAERDVVMKYNVEKPAGAFLEGMSADGEDLKVRKDATDLPANIISVDGEEMVIFATKNEAFLVRDPKYARVTEIPET